MLKIESMTIVRGNGPDVVILNTDIPSGIYPFTGTQSVRMDLAAGTAEDFIDKHFPNVPYTVVY